MQSQAATSNEYPAQDVLRFVYRLKADDYECAEFPIEIHKPTMTLIPAAQEPYPFWTELAYHQCHNCPLQAAQTPHCPVAVNLAPLLELCGHLVSHKPMSVEVVTDRRTVSCESTAQHIASSILGLIMATSPCPHTEYLKPMARFHLPLADQDETIYRVTATFLLAQYFRRRDGLPYSLELEELLKIYQNLQIINLHLTQRLKAGISEDAAVNGVILLDLLSKTVSWSIEDGLEEISYLFDSYRKPLQPPPS
ncbi:DUF6901 family protein [Methylomonas koyamae]|uniref:Uncharacterized protein n=1 Tax=Methylomonas koyamae TaxID=702114 RepID=A0A291IKK8_9GAMM|nr:hypothetical protein [Methylomonas koyamae]ATG90842.1 hypothetical protein MKLM6_2626 [Methylomonas koyamae]OAI27948.1 hypothetical protein A1356_08180 [Methylomonas koyamae]